MLDIVVKDWEENMAEMPITFSSSISENDFLLSLGGSEDEQQPVPVTLVLFGRKPEGHLHLMNVGRLGTGGRRFSFIGILYADQVDELHGQVVHGEFSFDRHAGYLELGIF